MKQSKAVILNANPGALAVTASAARMSTQEGTALEIYAKSGDHDRDLGLIGKVLASGHKSVIEHQTFSVALNDVSVLAEQFIIEFRLASYTVKSRRYVDFSQAGYVVPESLNGGLRECYCAQMERLFEDYSNLLKRGIPKEDARFLFPYALRSNFFMTVNARELIHMICSMLAGRGANFEELRQLGGQLKAQFDEIYPGVIDKELTRYRAPAAERMPSEILAGRDVRGGAALLSAPQDAREILETAMAFSGRFEPQDGRCLCAKNMALLCADSRPRELEALHYTFRVSNISLACLTHFTRHRMLSLQIPKVLRALCGGQYVLPESVHQDPEAERVYRAAFQRQAEAARQATAEGAPPEILSYYAMSGHVLDILLTANARELLHLAKLRTCNRAQWEIRGVAREMLLRLNEHAPEIFSGFGPSCAVTGRCPEGRMSCGRPVRIENGKWIAGEAGERT